MEQIQIIGNIGRDAERKNHNGSEFVTFSVAVARKWTNANNEKQESTNWYNVVSKNMKLAQYLVKGTKVFIQGPLKTGMYKNQSGNWNVDLSVNADKIEFLSSVNKDGQTNPVPTPPAAQNSFGANATPLPPMNKSDDDFPF